MSRDLAAIHKTALEQFKLVALIEQAQRERELEDLKFADPIEPSDQWPSDALNSRAGLPQKGSFPAVPARPALTINKLRQPLQQIINAQRQARLSLIFAPDGEGTSPEDAEAFEDIARAIQTDSRAHLARNWAFDRAVKCGRGFYRIETEYVNDRSRDQKICYKRILNQFSVYYDPFCQEPDFSDAQWCFVTEDMPWAKYQAMYPDSELACTDDEELTAMGDPLKGWVTETEQGKFIRVAEYFFFETTTEELVHVTGPDGTTRGQYRSELPNKFDESQLLKDDTGDTLSRSVEMRHLRWGKLNGIEFLTDKGETEPIKERDGQYIPIVPVIADESNIKGERRYTGVVRPSMDAQRLFNVEASTLAESVHLAPLAPYIGYANQFEGLDAWWSQLNTRRFPYLPVNAPRDQMEAGLALPQRNTAEQPIQAIAVSLQHAEHYIDITSGVPPAALGQLDPHERSGKAVLALQNQSDLATSGYADNLANMSMLLEGKILRDLIPKIYDRHGRTVAAQSDDDARRVLMLNAPFVQDQQKRPVLAQPQQPGAKTINLKRAEVAVSPTIGKSHTTKREEGSEQMGNLAQAAPELVPAFADLWVKNMDFPGARQIGDRLAKAVPPQYQDDPQNNPQALQTQLAQAKQAMQQLQELADKNKTDLQKTQMNNDAELKRTQIELQAKERLALVQQLGQLAAVDAKVDAENARSMVDAAIARIGKEVDFRMQKLDQVHAALTQRQQQAHEIGSQLVEHAHEANMAQIDHANTLEQGAQQAALAPQPTDNGASA